MNAPAVGAIDLPASLAGETNPSIVGNETDADRDLRTTTDRRTDRGQREGEMGEPTVIDGKRTKRL